VQSAVAICGQLESNHDDGKIFVNNLYHVNRVSNATFYRQLRQPIVKELLFFNTLPAIFKTQPCREKTQIFNIFALENMVRGTMTAPQRLSGKEK
jgi:hypothetical protein